MATTELTDKAKINLINPTISYLGAVELMSSENGSLMFSLFISIEDYNIFEIASLLMCEYKLIDETNDNNNDNNTETVSLNTVASENIIMQSGVSNQLMISIPVPPNLEFDPVPKTKIEFRAYFGITGSSEVAVTNWSNSLYALAPPPEPIFHEGYTTLSLNSETDIESNTMYLFIAKAHEITSVKYVVAYYYNDTTNNTVWQVTEPIQAEEVDEANFVPPDSTDFPENYEELQMLTVPNFGLVKDYDDIEASAPVYAAIYCVYTYFYQNKYYHSVSKISETHSIELADLYTQPQNVNIVYDDSSVQEMTINWTAPTTNKVPNYQVANYILELRVDNEDGIGEWVEITDDIIGSATSYVYDVSEYNCGDKLNFRVKSVSSTGGLGISDEVFKYIFIMADAPSNLSVTNTSQNEDGDVSMTVSWSAPYTGCGQLLSYTLVVNNGEYILENILNTVTSVNLVDNTEISESGVVQVYAVTGDTNLQNTDPGYNRNGEISNEYPYISSTFTLEPIDYNVYNTNSNQTMFLEWRSLNGEYPDWIVDSYEITVTGVPSIIDNFIEGNGSFTNGTNTTYNFDTLNIVCGRTLSFFVTAHMSNGDVHYDLLTNTESKTLFRYSQKPTFCRVVYALSDFTDKSVFDCEIKFKNTPNVGCGTPYKYVVTVHDKETDEPVDEPILIDYVDSTADYTAKFDALTNSNDLEQYYFAVYLQTYDTNEPLVLRNGEVETVEFTLGSVPVFINKTFTEESCIFEIRTVSLLTVQCALIDGTQNPPSFIKYMITEYEPEEDTANNVYMYTLVIVPNDFNGASVFPNQCVFVVSNASGVGANVIQNIVEEP